MKEPAEHDVCPMGSMISETSETTGSPGEEGHLYYDGECDLCAGLARRAGPWLDREGINTAPLQSPGAAESLGVPEESLLEGIRLRTREGQVLGGADALLFLAGRAWWARPFVVLGSFRLGRHLLRAAYRRVAANRKLIGRLMGVRAAGGPGAGSKAGAS